MCAEVQFVCRLVLRGPIHNRLDGAHCLVSSESHCVNNNANTLRYRFVKESAARLRARPVFRSRAALSCFWPAPKYIRPFRACADLILFRPGSVRRNQPRWRMFIAIRARRLESCQRRHRDKISGPAVWPCNSKRPFVFVDMFRYAPAHDSKKTFPVGTKYARSRALRLRDESTEP